jgi:vancomycin resistance protein VanW
VKLKAVARHLIPYEIRLRYKLWQRGAADQRAGVRFAATPPFTAAAHDEALDNLICVYERPIIDYERQTQFGAEKRHNLALLASQLNGVIVQPGETFSIWRLAGRPSETTGYLKAAGLKNRKLVSDVGGSTCLMSTVLYNVALLGAMEVTERYCHSVDVYGEGRYFELGRDASIEYGYLDLRFRNPHAFPVLLTAGVSQDAVTCALYSAEPHAFEVEIAVDPPVVQPAGKRVVRDRRLGGEVQRVLEAGTPGLQVAARRIIRHADGFVIEESLPGSLHHPVPAIVAVGRPVAGRVSS